MIEGGVRYSNVQVLEKRGRGVCDIDREFFIKLYARQYVEKAGTTKL